MRYLQLSYVVLILSGIIGTTNNFPKAAAESIPDNSLGIESSTVTSTVINGRPASLIQGGATRRKATVFHSFEKFNVSEDQAVYFDNPSGIRTIVSRVTGNGPSNIAGTLGLWNRMVGTLGNADLFFINPRGIAFGPKAALDLNGSFIASTATSVNFGDEYQFSTIHPSSPPLLTINIPTGLQFSMPGTTISSQAAFNVPLQTFGLAVAPGNTLALVGGNVAIQGGTIIAPEGRIELGGVLSGEVGLQPGLRGWKLDYSQVKNFQDILVDQQSTIGANGVGGGEIHLQGKDIVINNLSRLFATVNFGFVPGGPLAVDATDTLQISNGSSIVTSTLADGNAGDVLIKANKVSLQNDSVIATDSASIDLGFLRIIANGNSGDLYITAPQSIELSGNSRLSTRTTGPGNAGQIVVDTGALLVRDGSEIRSIALPGSEGRAGHVSVTATQLFQLDRGVLSTETFGFGDAGDINIISPRLVFSNGGQVRASTANQGKGGNINALVSEQISISGSNPDTGQSSGIFSVVDVGAFGSGGKLTLNTEQLNLFNAGQISTSSAGPGNAGEIDIRALQGVSLTDPGSGVFANTTDTGRGGTISFITPNFLITNGAVVDVRTSGDGPGGNIFIQADQFTARQGGHLVSTASGRGRAGDITLNVRDNITLTGTKSGVFANTTVGSNGAAGSIFIDPIQVLIANGAAVSVNSQGSGMGGDIQLRAQNLTLDQGQITAEAQVARAGDIQLDIDNLLLLRNGSLISTTAGGDATGGNIDIDANLIVAFPQEDSDITANALDGPGGNITITTQGLFGLEVRDTLTNASDITAFSQNNPELNGIVEINTPEVDPSDNLSDQPEAVEPPTEIAQGCEAQVASSSFIYKGRGGLPQSPAASMGGDAVWQDLRPMQAQTTGQPLSKTSPESVPVVALTSQPVRVEAKGWQRLPDGKVMLVAQAVDHSSQPPVASC